MVVFVQDCEVVCVFVNDCLDVVVLEVLYVQGVCVLLLCCVGFNNVDVVVVQWLGLFVVCVLVYFFEVVVEYMLVLVMMFNCQMYCVYNCVCDGNFMFDGLFGCMLYGKMVGIVGIGQIGLVIVWIFYGMGCMVLGYDLCLFIVFEVIGVFVVLEVLLVCLDIVLLYCLLMLQIYYLIDMVVLVVMKFGVMLVNILCGGLVDIYVVINVLKLCYFGYLVIDVYEQESVLFFQDCFGEIIDDEVFQCLMIFLNVLVIGYQGFFIVEVLQEIVQIMLCNLGYFVVGMLCLNVVLLFVGQFCRMYVVVLVMEWLCVLG